MYIDSLKKAAEEKIGRPISKERFRAIYELLRSGKEVKRKDIEGDSLDVAAAILDVMEEMAEAISVRHKHHIRLVELEDHEKQELEDHIRLRNAALFQKIPEIFDYVNVEGNELTLNPQLVPIQFTQLLVLLRKLEGANGILYQEKNWIMGEIVYRIRKANPDFTYEGIADTIKINIATVKSIHHTFEVFNKVRFPYLPWSVHREIGFYTAIEPAKMVLAARFCSKYKLNKVAAVRVCRQIEKKGIQMFRYEKRLLELSGPKIPNKQQFILVDKTGKFKIHNGHMRTNILEAYSLVLQVKPKKSIIKDRESWLSQ